MKFNEKLQALRKDKGISQEALAEMLGVSRQAISKWENGTAYPETEKMIALCEIFGVTLDSLIRDGELHKNEQETRDRGFEVRSGFYYGYKYKSSRTLFGLPLVHINVGRGRRRAKGIIAVGNIATGFVSVGLVSAGLLSFGVASAGLVGIGAFSLGLLLSMGAVSIGTFAAGAIALGFVTVGALSVGVYSMGACAVAARVAVGDHAYGTIAAGRVVKGAITFVAQNRDFSTIPAKAVRDAIYSEFPGTWKWLANFLTSF